MLHALRALFPPLISAALLGLGLAACGTGEGPPPAGEPSTEGRSILPPELTGSLERTLMAQGDARLLLDLRGAGRVRVSAGLEGEAAGELANFDLTDHFALHGIELPGAGLRPVALSIEAPASVEWRDLRLVDAATDADAAASSLIGSCAGRNVVIFLADSLTAKHTSIGDYERHTTPGLDRLTDQGVRFENAHSQTSWTLSSVASLFTGQMQERHGTLRIKQSLPQDLETLAQSFKAAGYETIGLVQNGVVWPHTLLDRGFDKYQIAVAGNDVSERIMRRATRMMLEPREKPLFLYVHLTPPHQPYHPPAHHAEGFVDPAYDGEVVGSLLDCARLNQERPATSDPDVRQLQALYDGHIHYVDTLLTQALAEVEDQGRRDDWLTVITSDHGEAFLQHGVQGHNTQVYQEMIHVPLWLIAPGSDLPIGRREEALVSLLDVAPTLRELVGLPAPEQHQDGRSLLPLLEDPTAIPERPLFFSNRYPKEAGLEPAWIAVRYGDHKLLRSKRGVELYDLSADPDETRDLSDELPLVTAALEELLDGWRRAGVRSDAEASEISAEAQEQFEKLGYAGDE